MTAIRNIVVLTGAGISAESGIPTFRIHGAVSYWEYDDGNRVRKRHRVAKESTPINDYSAAVDGKPMLRLLP